jgi:hypothetical protein
MQWLILQKCLAVSIVLGHRCKYYCCRATLFESLKVGFQCPIETQEWSWICLYYTALSTGLTYIYLEDFLLLSALADFC